MKLRVWDRLLLWSSLISLIVLSWYYFLVIKEDMTTMEMAGMDMRGMHPWGISDFLMISTMWVVMMIGMMVPTALRAILIYTRVAETASARGRVIASVYWFVIGYVVIWIVFGVGAALLQAGLNHLGLLSPTLASCSATLGSVILIGAGVYQLTPWKDVCLQQCQSPAAFFVGRLGPEWKDGLRLGLGHGAYCLGCCWILMLLLFVGGVMNFIWIAAIAGFVLLEKLLPAKFYLSQAAALLLIGVGISFLIVR
jgi:predicted metal-binding membrane protein